MTKDRSLRGLIDSGHADAAELELMFDFREWLIDLREDTTNRMPVRRNGLVKYRADGSLVYGPFTMPVRKRILEHLRLLEHRVGQQLISSGEIEAIEDIWWRDAIRTRARDALAQGMFGHPHEEIKDVAL